MGEKRGEVAFFIGCIQEAFLDSVNEATIRVLQRNGFEVHFPAGQTCCGAAQLHIGDEALAQELARKNIDAFERYDVIINNAGGCGATLKDEYEDLFHDDPVYAEKARVFGGQDQGYQRVPAGQPARAADRGGEGRASPTPTPATCATRRRSSSSRARCSA